MYLCMRVCECVRMCMCCVCTLKTNVLQLDKLQSVVANHLCKDLVFKRNDIFEHYKIDLKILKLQKVGVVSSNKQSKGN